MHQLGDEVEFPSPLGSKNWPRPRGDVYPMKESDTLLPNGLIHSGGHGRVKFNQHERRTVIQWTDDRWVVVRLPIANPGVDATS